MCDDRRLYILIILYCCHRPWEHTDGEILRAVGLADGVEVIKCDKYDEHSPLLVSDGTGLHK